jgi:hypothetical protein
VLWAGSPLSASRHHTLNCAVHDGCVAFRRDHPEDFASGELGRDPPRDDPCHVFPAPMPPQVTVGDDPGHPDPWPLK